MNRKYFCFFVIIAVMVSLAGIRPVPSNTSKDKESIRVIEMTITPAGEPTEALKYKLMPSFIDQTPGNAAIFYLMAIERQPHGDRKELRDKINDWLKISVDELPRQESKNIINSFSLAFRQLDRAVLCEQCDWQTPVRTEGFSALIPPLSEFRHLGKVLALQVRLQIADGKYNEAIHTLQNGFTMARHVAENPILIGDLVGIGIATLMYREVEQFIQAPDSPNLYWALSALPRPFIDMRRAMECERDIILMEFPELRDLETKKLTQQQASTLANDMFSRLSELGVGDMPNEQLGAAAWVMLQYHNARAYLIEHGRSPDQVEALPVAQVVLLYQLKEFIHIRDQIFKWFNVPYLQAKDGLKKAEDYFNQYVSKTRKKMTPNYFLDFLPALGRAYYLMARLERNIDILRCIEAVRMYAADHNGQLPGSLDDITKVPVPPDPLTGKMFSYKIVDGKAVIESILTPDDDPKDSSRYELTVRK
ncbi:MAG: hypothetical protein KAT56_10900 [Sedimentisphaerales bacterium]|nr:hypothetical protein [Sedimentisphaerales bacterium]